MSYKLIKLGSKYGWFSHAVKINWLHVCYWGFTMDADCLKLRMFEENHTVHYEEVDGKVQDVEVYVNSELNSTIKNFGFISLPAPWGGFELIAIVKVYNDDIYVFGNDIQRLELTLKSIDYEGGYFQT